MSAPSYYLRFPASTPARMDDALTRVLHPRPGLQRAVKRAADPLHERITSSFPNYVRLRYSDPAPRTGIGNGVQCDTQKFVSARPREIDHDLSLAGVRESEGISRLRAECLHLVSRFVRPEQE